MSKIKQNHKDLIIVSAFGIVTIALWQFPWGTFLLYPFTILGTWFHEMGHGIAAIFLGGNFIKLDIFPDGSGVAYHSGNLFLGPIGRALVAAAGPMGPTLIGVLIILSLTAKKASRLTIISISVLMIVSCVIWIRPILGFGFFFIMLLGIILFYIGLKGSEHTARFVNLFIAVQAFASVYLSIDYLFSAGGTIGMQSFKSDTAVMAENLFLPYWFWGGLILLLSLVSIVASFVLFAKTSRE